MRSCVLESRFLHLRTQIILESHAQRLIETADEGKGDGARTHAHPSHIQKASYRGRGARRIARRVNVCARSAIVAGPITFAHLIRRRRVRRASIDSERRTEGRASCAHRNHSAFERLGRMDGLRKTLILLTLFRGTNTQPALVHRSPLPLTQPPSSTASLINNRRMSVF